MKNKKASIGIVIGVFILILFLIGITVALIMIVENSKKIEPIQEEYPIKLYLRALSNENQVNSNYRIESNNTVLSSGILNSDSFTEIKVPRSEIKIICYSDYYYLSAISKTFNSEEINSNVSKVDCNLKEIGDIKVTHTGSITEGESIIKLNISSDKNLKNIKICNSWTPGIISAFQLEKNIICEKSDWLNFTNFDVNSKTYTYLPNNFYRCGDCVGVYCDLIEECTSVNGRFCTPVRYKEPERYKMKVDNCFDTGKSINSNSILVEYLVKGSNLNSLDYVKFYVMDSDIRFNVVNNFNRQMTEINGVTIGADDMVYVVDY